VDYLINLLLLIMSKLYNEFHILLQKEVKNLIKQDYQNY